MLEIQINILSVLAIMAVVAALLSFYVVSSIVNFRKVNALRIQSVKNLVAHEERLKKKIAAELHDEFASSLASIRMGLQNIDSSEKEVTVQLQKAVEEITALSPRIRDLSFNLMPIHLARYGLGEIIKDLVQNSAAAGLKTNIKIPKLNLHPDVSLQIFRIVQEIYTNILKHAHATKCDITFRQAKKFLFIDISDNGVGFDSRKIGRESKGIGLINLQSRIDILHGKLKLATEQGAGVQYHLKIPVNAVTQDQNSHR